MIILFIFFFSNQLVPQILAQAITDPINNVIKDFDQTVDLNAFFHYHQKSQYENAYKCSSRDGPYCNFINGKFFGEQVVRKDSKLKEQVIEEMLRQLTAYDEWASDHSNNEQIFLTASRLKEMYFEEQEGKNSKNQRKIQNILITFGDLKISSVSENLNNYEYEINQQSKSFHLKKQKPSNQIQDETSEEVKITFKNLYTPKKNQIYSNWLQKYHKDSEIEQSFFSKIPNQNYVYTQDCIQFQFLQQIKKEEGTIKFSIPVKFYHLYLRFHDFGLVEQQQILKTGVKFYLGNKLIKEIIIEQPNIYNYNVWFQIELEGKLIDQIVLNQNLDLDNIYFQTEYYLDLVPQKQVNLKAFQKGEKYENLEKLEKEITDQLQTKLNDMGIDIQIIPLEDEEEIEEFKENIKRKLGTKQTKLKSKQNKYDLIEQEIQNLETLVLTENILTISKQEFNGLLTKFLALKKEVIEINDPKMLKQYQEIMLVLKEIEKVRELGTIEPESATIKELNKLQEKLENANIDLTKFPGFIEKDMQGEEEEEYSLFDEEVELTETDEEEIKKIFSNLFGQELDEDSLDEATKALNVKRAKKEKEKTKKKNH